MTETSVGSVSSVLRFPVKSMLGENVAAATVSQRGVDGDRAYALIDEETNKVISVKRPRRWGRIFELSAATKSDGPVEVTFPGGEAMAIDDPALPDRLSAFFGRRVSVAATPPPDATFDEAWERDLKDGADPYFGLPSRDEEGDELIDAGAFMSGQGNFFNFGAVHLVTTATTKRLSEAAPDSRFDARRFRPNIVIDTDEVGFVETGWQGHTLAIGDVRLLVTFTVPRCVMTTLAQGDLPADRDVLRTITAENSVDVFSTGTAYPCVGVYGEVVTGGDVRVGDAVTLIS
ncbi:MAG: MOSC domain-containing protein [Actinobacteria bacterium]|nr:MOSC domain-containing protein [Actinomycetota bacterium]